MIEFIRALQSDPFVVSFLAGGIWPIIQASLNRPWWTRRRRVALVVAASVIASVGVWVAGSYPASWRLFTAQASVFLGNAWVVYQALSMVRIGGVDLLEWVGIYTPGGMTKDDLVVGTLTEDAQDS